MSVIVKHNFADERGVKNSIMIMGILTCYSIK